MTKKRKYHDPMKTVTQTIQYNGKVRHITYKEKHTKAMERIVEKENLVWNDMLQETSSFIPDWKNVEKVRKKYLPAFGLLHTKRAAMFLIANNIARRGKPLHPDTAIKKLRKLRSSTQAFIIENDIVEKSTVTDWPLTQNAEKNLHYFLYHDFGVTLMDKSVYDCCMKKIKRYKACGIYETHNLRHYENFVKKFHKNVINENQK